MIDLDEDMGPITKSSIMMEEVVSYSCNEINIANFEIFNQVGIQQNGTYPVVEMPEITDTHTCHPDASLDFTAEDCFKNVKNLKTYSAMKRTKTFVNPPRLETSSSVKRFKTTHVTLPSNPWGTQNDSKKTFQTPNIMLRPGCRKTEAGSVKMPEPLCDNTKKIESNIHLSMYKLFHLIPEPPLAVYTCLGCNKTGITSTDIKHHIMCVPWNTPKRVEGKLVNYLAASAKKLTPVNVTRGSGSHNPLPNAPVIKDTEIVSGPALLELMRALPKNFPINLKEFPKVIPCHANSLVNPLKKLTEVPNGNTSFPKAIALPDNSLVNPLNRLLEVPNANTSCQNSLPLSPSHNCLELQNVDSFPQNLPHITSNNQSHFLDPTSHPDDPSLNTSKEESTFVNHNSLASPKNSQSEFVKRKKKWKPLSYKLTHLKSRQVVTNAGLVTLYSCTVCNTENMLIGDLEKHMTCLKPQRVTFECDGCHKTFLLKKGLKYHRAACKPHECPHCSQVFPTLSTLRAHKKVHVEIVKPPPKPQPQRPLMCNFCSSRFWRQKELMKHLERHDTTRPEDVHLCHKCGKSFSKKKHLTYHDRMIHIKVVGKCICETCGKRFHFPSQLKDHVTAEHTKDRPFACEDCGKRFALKRIFKTHMMNHQIHDERCFRCRVCGSTFKRLAQLILHKAEHPELEGKRNADTQCLMCDRVFHTWDRMMHHLCNSKLHRGEHVFSCKLCSLEFRGAYNLFIHVKVEHSKWTMDKVNQRICTVCSKVFLSSIAKERHSRIHLPSEQGLCMTCGLKYSCKAERWEHEDIHRPQWKYSCSECDKTCRTQDHLLNHLRVHTREKPYACHICHRAFPQISTRNKHLITVHRNLNIAK